MRQYLDLLDHVMTHGKDRLDRTEVGTRGVFAYQLRFDLSDSFPLLTTKKLHLRSIIYELLWFLKGRTDNQWLEERGVTIWREWATPEKCARWGREPGDLGPIYSKQWRNFGGIDQIAKAIDTIKNNPWSRRIIVSAWNPPEADMVDLPPCHTLFQFYVHEGELSCHMYQRSCDIFLGVPFNIASYAILTRMIAQVTGTRARELIITLGDAHIYRNHFDQVKLQLTRIPRALPKLEITPGVNCIDDFAYEDFRVVGYDPYPTIKAEIAV